MFLKCSGGVLRYSSRIILVVAAMMLPNVLLCLVAAMKGQVKVALLFLLLSLIGLACNAVIIRQLNEKIGDERERIVSIKRFNFDTFSHIVSYVPSLLAISLDFSAVGTAIVTFYIFYMAMIAITDVVVLNPFLHFLGWRFQPATLELEMGTEEIVVITPPKSQLKVGYADLSKLTDFGIYLLRN
jgi:hypothetical protein